LPRPELSSSLIRLLSRSARQGMRPKAFRRRFPRQFAILQKYNRMNLVVPVSAPHMWHAAMESKACKLPVLGEHYRRLVANKQIERATPAPAPGCHGSGGPVGALTAVTSCVWVARLIPSPVIVPATVKPTLAKIFPVTVSSPYVVRQVESKGWWAERDSRRLSNY
jgi:hypothetical protein